MASLISFSLAALLATLLIPISDIVARKTGAMAKVQNDRWHRSGEIPRLGGPALLVALLPWLDFSLMLVLGGFCSIGVWDDHRPLSPIVKGVLLVIPCLAAGWYTGNVWIAVACWFSANLLNMLDNADGVAASTSAGSLAIAGGELGLCGAGVSLGFLVRNWPPARTFLGDGGSLMLGAFIVLAWSAHGIVSVVIGVAIPLVDGLYVVINRMRKRKPVWIGGKDHLGHVLLQAGTPPWILPLIYGGVTVIVAITGRFLFVVFS